MTLFGKERGDEFAIRRRQMVERQLVPRGITDQRVLSAMGTVPRHLFVEEALRSKAYSDNALPIGLKQTISQPYIVALMIELLRVEPEHKVLEIGAGSGYQAAVLAGLARSVHAIERLQPLAGRARATLKSLGIENVAIRVGDGTKGWPEEAPFDRIVVAAGSPRVPPALITQLADGGRMVIPVGMEREQAIQVIVKEGADSRTEHHERCVFVKLIGEEGWEEPSETVS